VRGSLFIAPRAGAITKDHREVNMRAYEAVLIFRPDGDLLAGGREFVKNLFAGGGCKVLKEEDMGDRLLAYPIKKSKRGFYVFYELEAEPQNIHALDKALQLRSEILKYLFIRKEE
jgi:small subunit ribosomal protein S6